MVRPLPRIAPQCRITIAIPAKDEVSTIVHALDAFAAQRTLDGRPLDPRLFEVLVFANDCSDDTAAAVRAFASRHAAFAVHVVSDSLPRGAAHIGSARRIVLDLACQRQRSLHREGGIIASTDADSAVDARWVARTLDEMKRVHAVAGHVEVAASDRSRMQAPLRLMYDRECVYRRLLGEIEARFDPRPFDPPPRHDSFVGTSFAVGTNVYEAAGRLPVLPRLEDVAFAKALRRIDARIRHTYDVRVATSGRTLARVEGGFGTFIADLHARGIRHESFFVDNAARSIARAKARRSLRTFWDAPSDVDALYAACDAFGLTASTVLEVVDASAPFGETLDRIEAMRIAFELLPDEPIDEALATFRAALSAANAQTPTRISAASRAG